MCKISVLMPVYNAQKHLGEAIDSIIKQRYQDWELIIINDGSTDDSEDIILSFSDSRIKYYRNEGNKGIVYTRNRMIKMAQGQYIAFLDSDDVSMPDRLSRQLAFLEEKADYAMCGTWALMIDDVGNTIKKINMSTESMDIRCSLLFANTFVQSSVMIRKEILLENPYNEDYPVAEDYQLWCQLSHKYKLGNIPYHLTKYRWHGNNISIEKKTLMDKIIGNIYRYQLSYFGITPTEIELMTHAAIKDKGVYQIPQKLFLKQLKSWFIKLTRAKNDDEKIDKATLRATIVFRWIFACREWGNKSKILPFPISLSVKSLSILIRFLYERTK